MIRQALTLDIRHDKAGSGAYGAPRGSRTHCGIDYHCTPGEPVLSPVAGEVTKLGYPYGDDLTWRYVQITDEKGENHRLFYVEPAVALGQVVNGGEAIAIAQDISERYPDQGMLPHVHYEIKTAGGEFRNPEKA